MNPIGQTEFDKRREILKPYVGLRLNFEGVLVNINHANKRNGYHCGLVFASIYAKNEILELDHAVIKIHPKTKRFKLTMLYTLQFYGRNRYISQNRKNIIDLTK